MLWLNISVGTEMAMPYVIKQFRLDLQSLEFTDRVRERCALVASNYVYID